MFAGIVRLSRKISGLKLRVDRQNIFFKIFSFLVINIVEEKNALLLVLRIPAASIRSIKAGTSVFC